MSRATDREYCQERWRRFYIAGGFGDYDTAWTKFAKAHPEVVETMHRGTDQAAIAALRAEFTAADRDEDGETPFAPAHLREGFLDLFDIELPPMTASIDGGPDGRIPAEAATPKQQREAHATVREYHRRGYRYRDGAVQQWDELRKHLTDQQWQQQSLLDLIGALK